MVRCGFWGGGKKKGVERWLSGKIENLGFLFWGEVLVYWYFVSVGVKAKRYVIALTFISSFIITPVSGTINCDPNSRFIVVVNDIAMPDASAATICDVPGVSRLSSPAGSYQETFWVWKSEIFDRISAAVDAFSMSSSYSCSPLIKDGSPRFVR